MVPAATMAWGFGLKMGNCQYSNHKHQKVYLIKAFIKNYKDRFLLMLMRNTYFRGWILVKKQKIFATALNSYVVIEMKIDSPDGQ